MHNGRLAARDAASMTAQHLTRFGSLRQFATLIVFAIAMELALTDAAVQMGERWWVRCSAAPIAPVLSD